MPEPEIIELKIDGSTISTDWWTPEIRELFCSLCDEEKDKCLMCMNNNPWCG